MDVEVVHLLKNLVHHLILEVRTSCDVGNLHNDLQCDEMDDWHLNHWLMQQHVHVYYLSNNTNVQIDEGNDGWSSCVIELVTVIGDEFEQVHGSEHEGIEHNVEGSWANKLDEEGWVEWSSTEGVIFVLVDDSIRNDQAHTKLNEGHAEVVDEILALHWVTNAESVHLILHENHKAKFCKVLVQMDRLFVLQ